MSNCNAELSCEIQVRPGEAISLPPEITERVGAGRWLVTITPVVQHATPVRVSDRSLADYELADHGIHIESQTKWSRP